MYGTADMFNADTICSNTNDSVHNENAVIQFSLAIYCFCVLTQLYRDRRNIKYRQQTETQQYRDRRNIKHRQQTETHRQQVITNHILKRTAVWPMKGRARNDQNTNTMQKNIQYIQYKRQLYWEHHT
jgi:hypothetical protein